MFEFLHPALSWLWSARWRSVGAICWAIAVTCTWLHRELYVRWASPAIDITVSNAEEFCKTVVREVIRFCYRTVNSASVWIGALFYGGGWHRTGAAAWMDVSNPTHNASWVNKQSTLNAVVARTAAQQATGVPQGARACMHSLRAVRLIKCPQQHA